MTIGGLGSGLDFLYDENAADVQVKKTLRLSELEPNRDQPRKQFSEESIQTLADSIQQYGMIQPILVRPLGLNYQIVAGERRWRAARMLGLDEVPVVIRELSDEETMAIALIENLQRENLNPMEEANGYDQLMKKFNMTQDEVAKHVGKSRSAVANSLRLLKLPFGIKKMVEQGDLSAGHARALLGIHDDDLLLDTAVKASQGKLTVRAVEKIAANEAKMTAPQPLIKEDSFFTEIEISLEARLGRRVSVSYGKNKGTLNLEFYDKEDLAALAQRLTKE
ncbi:ParB/RepB/Spo0J family partition protein [uncultured Ruminococcus sp.]|uniref:ParB/RepB/Spo0J family partition protein n=1 Tax=uncultured Ruminococcus sp. TaxID=165186 RepID=UPI002604541E|nr:ParB/RepB/Spo0J family partition protein [uncultured Ruminococcus sp.]